MMTDLTDEEREEIQQYKYDTIIKEDEVCCILV